MAAHPKDREVISSYADERLRDLVNKGLLPEKPPDRLWLRQQFPKISPQPLKGKAVARAKLKFLKGLKKSSALPQEGSTETDLQGGQDNPSAASGFLSAFKKQTAQCSQDLEQKATGEFSGILPIYLACDSTTSEEPRQTAHSEPPETGCHMQEDDDDEEELRRTWRSEPPFAGSQAEDIREVIYPKPGRRLSIDSSVPKNFVLPPVKPPLKPPAKRRSSWAVCETAEVSRARNSAFCFLAKRGALA